MYFDAYYYYFSLLLQCGTKRLTYFLYKPVVSFVSVIQRLLQVANMQRLRGRKIYLSFVALLVCVNGFHFKSTKTASHDQWNALMCMKLLTVPHGFYLTFS